MIKLTQDEKDFIVMALNHLYTSKGLAGSFENYRRAVALTESIMHKLNGATPPAPDAVPNKPIPHQP